MILIVTHRRGFEADRIIDRLHNLGEPVFRLNTDIDPNYLVLTLSVSSDTKDCKFFSGERELNIKDITIAWFQQSWSWIEPTEPLEFARQQSYQALLEATLDEIETPWLNSPSSVKVASNKSRQLLNAVRVGLQIPTTLISNHPESVCQFAMRNSRIVAKSISPQWLNICGNDNAAYTQKFELSWITDRAAISYAPVAYQEFHRRKNDIRAVVVGDQVFCAYCEAKESYPAYDVRKEPNLQFVPHQLPVKIEIGLKNLMKSLGVQYCSADFIENMDGEIFFIDLNVSGSWWWIDDLYSGAVTDSIASYLLKHRR